MFIDFVHLGEGNTCPSYKNHHGFPRKNVVKTTIRLLRPFYGGGFTGDTIRDVKHLFQCFFGEVTFFGISKDLNFKPLKFNMEPDNLSTPGVQGDELHRTGKAHYFHGNQPLNLGEKNTETLAFLDVHTFPPSETGPRDWVGTSHKNIGAVGFPSSQTTPI